MKELLEAGVHFGHQVRRWNPKMKEYIFGERNGIYIIDLQKTQKMFREALQYVTNAIAEDRGKTMLFVGTKRQAQDAMREEAERADTNCSPVGVDYVIPRNDDALRAVRLFASRIADAVLEGQQMLTEGGAAVERRAGEEQPEPAVATIESAATERPSEESNELE